MKSNASITYETGDDELWSVSGLVYPAEEPGCYYVDDVEAFDEKGKPVPPDLLEIDLRWIENELVEDYCNGEMDR